MDTNNRYFNYSNKFRSIATSGSLIGYLLLIAPLALFAQGQETGTAPTAPQKELVEGFIDEDKTLSGGVYMFQNNIKVNKKATLTIEKGAEIIFQPNTSLVVEGGLTISGSPGNLVKLRSADENRQGKGIMVRGVEGGDININYARFEHLKMPLNFDMNWFRNEVNIHDNIFKNMNTGESTILITSPTEFEHQDSITTFNFSKNNFVNNWGSIFIENFQDNILDLKFDNNLISNNVVYGMETGVPANSPVFGLYDGKTNKYKAKIQNNSVFGNYQINSSTDSVIREVSFGIQGRGEVFDIPQNFFRSTNKQYVSSTFSHFYQNNELPLLKPEPIQEEPSEETHGHIYEVVWDGRALKDYTELPEMPDNTVEMKLRFNRKVETFDTVQMEWVHFDTINNIVNISPVEFSEPTWSNNQTEYSFTVQDAGFMKNRLGYLVFSHFEDEEGFEIPEFTIGQMEALNNYSRLYREGTETAFYKSAKMIREKEAFQPTEKEKEALEALAELGDLSYLGDYQSLANTWEVGIQVGATNYSGDLVPKAMDERDFRFGMGVYGQYNISKWFSANLGVNYIRVTGRDYDNNERIQRLRWENFRTNIWEFNLTGKWHMLQYGISKGDKFAPYLFAGINVFRMNPESRIFTGFEPETGDPQFLEDENGDDIWFPLQPIGTEGQTTDQVDSEFPNRTAPDQYNKWQLGIPFGIGFEFIISDSWTIGAEAKANLTFTDYLDDVSGFYFDRENRHQEIVDANPDIEGNVYSSTFASVFGGETVDVPEEVTITFDGKTETYKTAALLANPSLVFADETRDTENHAFGFPDARRGTDNRDWYFFFSVKASKIFGLKNNYEQQKMDAREEKEQFEGQQ